MLGSHFNKRWSEVDIVNKLEQHSFGNWLPEMAVFLENEGIATTIYTNSVKLPVRDNESPSLLATLETYSKTGTIKVEPIREAILNNKPMIINVDRSKLLGLHKGKAPHYVVLLKDKYSMTVHDPLKDAPFSLPFEKIYDASLDMNAAQHNGLLLLCS
jgi:hypothetical protein